LATQIRQALLLGLAYNLYRLRHRFVHRGCQQSLNVASKRLRGLHNYRSGAAFLALSQG
jgi:hypothetical protein